MSAGQNLIGKKYGELTVEALTGRTSNGSKLWLCRCDCGKTALRTTSELNYSAGRGYVSCCSACAREYLSGLRSARKNDNCEAWLGLWRKHGTLWSNAVTAKLEREIREAVGEELGGWREEAELPVEVMPCEEEASLAREDGAYYETSLQEIGNAFGVSRERIRQILGQALAKLRALPELKELLVDRTRAQRFKTQTEAQKSVAVDVALERARPKRRALTPREVEQLDKAIVRAYEVQAYEKAGQKMCVCGHKLAEHVLRELRCKVVVNSAARTYNNQLCKCYKFVERKAESWQSRM